MFLDIWLQGSRLDGLQLLDVLKADHPELPVVMISGHGNIETAVSAIKRGAYDFIEKPFKADRLVLVAERALENSRLRREVKELKQLAPLGVELVGHSPAANQLRQTIEKSAPTNSRILIVGPSGSGKELAARTSTRCSAGPSVPFVVINAAAITPERMEVELFGVEAGNGTGRKVGALRRRMAARCSSTKSPTCRARRRTRSCGCWSIRPSSGSAVRPRSRSMSASSRPPAAISRPISRAGKFREDLYHRLSVVPIRVPPLAERREDIPELVEYFMDADFAHRPACRSATSATDAMAVLQSHDWPGNVRQLRNNVERLMILAGGDPDAVITASMLPQDVGSMIPSMPNGNGGEHLMGLPLREAREVFEREYLLAQINRFGGNISRTAEFVGMERSALHRKLKALGLTERARKPCPASPMSTAATCRSREAKVHVEDRGYQFADGVYEVCEVRGGSRSTSAGIMARLARSLGELRIALPMPLRALDVVLREVVRRNRSRYGIVYLQITRGVARRDHAFPLPAPAPALVVTARSLDCAAQRGARGRRHRRHLRAGQPLGACRHQDDRAVARMCWPSRPRRAGRARRLVRRQRRPVTEGASTNAWIVTGEGSVVTRPADHAILNGITRTVLIDAHSGAGAGGRGAGFTLEEAYTAREAFVTAATQIVLPVVRIDGRPVGDGGRARSRPRCGRIFIAMPNRLERKTTVVKSYGRFGDRLMFSSSKLGLAWATASNRLDPAGGCRRTTGWTAGEVTEARGSASRP